MLLRVLGVSVLTAHSHKSIFRITNGPILSGDYTFKKMCWLFQIDQNAREDFNLTSDGELNAIKSLVLGKVHGEYKQRGASGCGPVLGAELQVMSFKHG